MQGRFGVSNSKLDPRATCDEYNSCSTVNSIPYRPLEEVWFKAVALLAAYEGLDREAEQWPGPLLFPTLRAQCNGWSVFGKNDWL